VNLRKFLCSAALAIAYTGPIMAPQEPIRKRPPGPVREIPDKLYFRIGEVAKLCEVPAYVLRFWEGEFPQLKPNKGGTGQRLYRRRDVEMALRIKTLLYDEGYTIPGARQAFKAELRSSKDPQLGLEGVGDSVDARHLQALQKELRELHAMLSKPAVARTAVQAIRAPQNHTTNQAPAAPVAPPAPMEFPKPKLLTVKPKESQADAFVNSLFDDLPPLK
jgi:DNA-binding transcriptional MerR regulator